MHTPRIFTSKSDSGYCYSGTASTAYRGVICSGIKAGSISRDNFFGILQGRVGELREIFDHICQVDPEVTDLVARTAYVGSLVDIARIESSVLEEGLEGKLCNIVQHLYDMLHVCAAVTCNKEKFRNPDFVERRTYLQMAQACGIVVNSIAILNCYAQATAADIECGAGIVSDINASLSVHLHAKCAALLGCLKSAMRAVSQERRKTVLLAVRHYAEIARKVAELFDLDMVRCFRHRTVNCLNMILDTEESDFIECEVMLRRDAKSLMRLSLATEAHIVLCHNLDQYVGKSEAVSTAQSCATVCINALMKTVGYLLRVYREYAASGEGEHSFACSISRCIRVLRDNVYPRVSSHECGEAIGAHVAHEVYLRLCEVSNELENIMPELLVNPRISSEWYRMALCSLAEMSSAWKSATEAYFHVPEQPESLPTQPSTSAQALLCTSSESGDAQVLVYRPRTPSWDIEPPVMCTSSVLEEARVSSHRSSSPGNDDLEPPIKRSRSA
ncbi:HGE-14 family type IV secretion system effector [Anaplasma phagocytophilum]|uniref:HGE-14 family type IV secretion system effector n=1 Tax=Anaplasma phagocytophilum TaxID=948 RepID=UPI00200C2BDB|nr:hypothetical protein [Anaplasma phagocytophilum]UQD53991.1 hypothetical protein ESP60_00600 [Anaplasma phagocytophilum]